MLVNVILTQNNKAGKTTFRSFKKFNIGNDELNSISKDIASFCKDAQIMVDKLHKLGTSANFRFYKSHPLSLSLVTDDDVLKVDFKNFGKFVEQSTEKTLREAFKIKIAFVEKHGFNEMTLTEANELLAKVS